MKYATPVEGYIPLSIWQDPETGLGWLSFDYGNSNPLEWPRILSYKGGLFRRMGYNSDTSRLGYCQCDKSDVAIPV